MFKSLSEQIAEQEETSAAILLQNAKIQAKLNEQDKILAEIMQKVGVAE